MVTTRHSARYTDYAISSLVEHTKIAREDQVVLIDNDHSYEEFPDNCRALVKVKVNSRPLSFAANVNQIMEVAGAENADVVFLNNDLIFSPGWFEPFRARGPFLTCPLTNVELPNTEGEFQCKYSMELEDYLGNENRFLEFTERHRKKFTGYLKVMSLPFSAIKIPYQIYSAVGQLDETFGVGGGEDKDYCIRCHERGFEIRYALGSYVLHFHGRSTWRGAETAEETAARDRRFTERFRQKWGQALLDVFVFNNLKNIPDDVRAAHEKGDFRYLVERLRPERT
jgi:GT2 family glycosyltransferase